VISSPLSPSAAFRLSGFYRQSDGIVKDALTGVRYNDVEAYGFRGKLRWRPAESVDLLLALDSQRFHSNCCALPMRAASKNPIVPNAGIAVCPLNDAVALGGSNVFADQENYGGALTGNVSFSGYTLTYIGAGRKWAAEGDFDIDSTPAHIVTSNFNTTDATQMSHELRLVSPLSAPADYV
jgi:iron complex outermembrane receptor protein